MNIIKKDGTLELYDEQKIINAIHKSAQRVMIELVEKDYQNLCSMVWGKLVENELEDTEIYEMHNIVESVLEEYNPVVAKSYKDYRNYKNDFIHMMDDVYTKSQAIRYIGDKSNANTDSALVATKRSLIFNELNKALFRKFFMTREELQACKEGYFYIHDQSARLDTINCFRRDTRFITEQGIKSFYDFNDRDSTYVISHTGKWRKATIKKYGWQQLQEVTFKRGAGIEKTVYCTKNHRWLLKDGSETTSLTIGDKLIYTPKVATFDWDGLTRKEKKLWCLGFAFADGSVVSDNNIPTMHLRLCGDKSSYVNRFEEAGYTATFPESSKGDAHIRMIDIHSKEIPWLILSKDNVKYLMNGYMSADGNKTKDTMKSQFRGVQVTGDRNSVINDLLNMSGYYVTSTRDLTGQKTNYGIRKNTTIHYQTYDDCGDKTWVVTNIKESKLNSKAEVWCLEVEVDHSFLLEGGIPTGNCCLIDIATILKDGFEMGNVWYNEPKSIDTAFDVIGDIILSTAAQQYGGFTVPEIDKILAPYAEKSYKKYVCEYEKICEQYKGINFYEEDRNCIHENAQIYALSKVKRDFEQGWQGIEYKLNTVGSSRGDYPFVTVTIGLGTKTFEKMAAITLLKIHQEGQGKEGHKIPVLFPKIVFLYDENIHGDKCINEDIFSAGVECSSKTMYPDWLSMSGDGYISSMYKKYGKVISPMGCRAFLSPWYERGGMSPADENDTPIFVGRFNMGAVSLHLPMILAKAKQEDKDFYEVLDYYLEIIRRFHIRTIDYIGEMRASTNPLAYCEGGFYGGNLDPNDKIKSILKPMTISFGITALNELQQLYNKKSLVEDGQFAIDVMEHINKKVNQFKEEDNILYAIYSTPAESLCGLQIKQFRKKYGIIENVSDREYVSNSFHCHVTEDITPIQKQDLEYRFWELSNGGKIQYVKYPINYNTEAIKTLIRRAMKMGLYEGVNLSLSYCTNCGHQELNMDICTECNGTDITKIDRMNGYLSFSRVHGDTRLNDAKMSEISDRRSM